MFERFEFSLDELKPYVVGSDNEIYRRPYESKGRSYGYRRIKMQYPSRWKLNETWWSKHKLWNLLEDIENGKQIYKEKF